MNDNELLVERKRGRHLFIVEGEREKNELLGLMLKIFPEIDIDMKDVLVYHSNIYMLYDDIVAEYQEDWDIEDVDLPFILSKKQGAADKLYKRDFMNIILFFDYERHDPRFSEDKILKLQKYFQDTTDVGKLFLNYPMIESYQDLNTIPDPRYADRKIPVTMQPGHRYKNEVKNTSIAVAVDLPRKLNEILEKKYFIEGDGLREEYIDIMLNCDNINSLEEKIVQCLTGELTEEKLLTAKGQLRATIRRIGHLEAGVSYYAYMRNMFSQVIYHNIRKAIRIQNGEYGIDYDLLKEYFYSLDFDNILLVQNECSKDPDKGCIWVLNTSVFFVPDYNFQLMMPEGYEIT